MTSSVSPPPLLLQQQEKLQRLVDETRHPSASISDHPLRLHVEPIDDASRLVESDNVAVSKFVTVIAHDCIHITNLTNSASKNLYRQLVLFGHSASPHEVLLEGEPQKAFAKSMPLFMELYETVNRMTDLLGNLLQQLNAIYSLHDKNVRPLSSFKNFVMRTALGSLGDGLAMFLVLDEILRQNERVKGYLSLLSRMFSKVKQEMNTFDIMPDDLDFLDQVISFLEKLLDRSLQKESLWKATLEQLSCNKKFSSSCISYVHDGLTEILPRLDSWKEFPFDRQKILQHVALFLFSAYSSAPEKKIGKLLLEMLQLVPVIYIEGGKRVILLEVLKNQGPQFLSSWSYIQEASRDADHIKNNYLKRLSELLSRDWEIGKDSIICWLVSFQTTINHPTEMLAEGWVRLHLKKTMQGIILANRLHLLILSILDLHALLEVPIQRGKLKSLCHMVISLKILENTFMNKGPDMIRCLPHIINVIQADIEHLIVPSKDKLQNDVVQKCRTSKFSLLNSLIRGGKEIDPGITDTLSLALMMLQLLQGGGSLKRRITFSVTLDILESIGYLDVDFLRIRKLSKKLAIVASYQSIIEQATDCSFLYWRKEMIGNLFSLVYEEVNRFLWIQHAIDALSDGLRLLGLGNVGNLTCQSYQKEIEDLLEQELLDPLCKDIETDLRLHVHSMHLKGSVIVNPTKTGVRNLSWYLHMKPLRLPSKLVDIRLYVEKYLNSSFYNHLTMSTYEWKIYTEMSQLGELKYCLKLSDIHLPVTSAALDFDIIDTIDDLDYFFENYSYNIALHILVENAVDGQSKKNLRVINSEHVVSAFATHGLKSVSKALDSIAHYVHQIFTSLSDLSQSECATFDMLKESTFLKKEKGKAYSQPSLQEGAKIIALGKVHLRDPGARFLEQLQSLLIKLGNALGFMRILFTGSSRYFSCSTLPWSRHCSSYEEMNVHHVFVNKTDAVEANMGNEMERNYVANDETKSFSSFISNFLKEHCLIEAVHLNNFFIIVPSIILNMIDSKVYQKDKLFGGYHTSGKVLHFHDSFSIGVALVLKVLGQEKSFEELDWFSVAKKNLQEEVSLLEHSVMGSKERMGTALAGFKLWGRSQEIPVEVQKDLDKLKRHELEIEVIEYGCHVAKTLIS